MFAGQWNPEEMVKAKELERTTTEPSTHGLYDNQWLCYIPKPISIGLQILKCNIWISYFTSHSFFVFIHTLNTYAIELNI